VQSAPQLIPAGELTTVPLPHPDRDTVSVVVPVDDGEVDPLPEPLTLRVIVSPPPANVTLPTKLAALVGLKRTTTDWVAPAARENEVPDTTLNGAPTAVPPDTVEPVMFLTVNVRSTVVPTVTVPKDVVLVGDTLREPRAAAETAGEHALSLPLRSTAVTLAQYVMPALSPVIVRLTIWLAVGAVVEEGTA
jgi:hypothetical protein